MRNFVDWLKNGEYTPFGEVFDVGCGCCVENDNGNGSINERLQIGIITSYSK